MMIPNNRLLRELGQANPKGGLPAALARVGRPLLYDPDHGRLGLPAWEHELIGVYWDNAAASAERLESPSAPLTGARTE